MGIVLVPLQRYYNANIALLSHSVAWRARGKSQFWCQAPIQPRGFVNIANLLVIGLCLGQSSRHRGRLVVVAVALGHAARQPWCLSLLGAPLLRRRAFFLTQITPPRLRPLAIPPSGSAR